MTFSSSTRWIFSLCNDRRREQRRLRFMINISDSQAKRLSFTIRSACVWHLDCAYKHTGQLVCNQRRIKLTANGGKFPLGTPLDDVRGIACRRLHRPTTTAKPALFALLRPTVLSPLPVSLLSFSVFLENQECSSVLPVSLLVREHPRARAAI